MRLYFIVNLLPVYIIRNHVPFIFQSVPLVKSVHPMVLPRLHLTQKTFFYKHP